MNWVGIPYQLGGRSIEHGIDCLGLLLLRLAAAGRSVCDPWLTLAERWTLGEVDASREMPEPWIPVLVGGEQPLDVVVLLVGGRPTHVGVVESGGLVLHTSARTGSLMTRLATLRRAGAVHSVWRHAA